MTSVATQSDELCLLIKSHYPVVCVEAIDERYVGSQLAVIAAQLGLALYEWSITQGLKRRLIKEAYPDTENPANALKTILGFVGEAKSGGAALYVLKDFSCHLGDPLVLRLFKDIVDAIANTKTTLVIVAAKVVLPPDIEASTARIIAGYPSEAEIVETINETLGYFERDHVRPEVALATEDERRMVLGFKGLSLQQIRNVLFRCLLDSPRVDAKMLPRIEREKKKIMDREGLLEFCAVDQAASMANFDNLKRWLAERKSSFFRPAGSLPTPKGVLLMGVQGCGKSMAAKVIAGELGLALYRLDLIRFYSKYIGETESNLRKALRTIDELSPICLWIDEIEKNFASAADGDIDGGVSLRLLGTFLTWMQERTSKCFVAATANDVLSLPPEFLRKGRFDEVFFVDLPTLEIRETLFALHLSKRKLDPKSFDCGALAGMTAEFSGAEVEQAIIAALYRSQSRSEALSMKHLVEEVSSTRPLAVLKREEITALREWARDRTVPA